MSIGFVRCSRTPRLRKDLSPSASPSAVTRTTSRSEVAGSARRRLRNSRPDASGRCRSSRINAGRSVRASSRPSSARVAVTRRTSGRRASARSTSLTFTGSSSTWRIVGLGVTSVLDRSPFAVVPEPRDLGGDRADQLTRPVEQRVFVAVRAQLAQGQLETFGQLAESLQLQRAAAPRRLCASSAASAIAVVRSDVGSLPRSSERRRSTRADAAARRAGRRRAAPAERARRCCSEDPLLVRGRDRLCAPRDAELLVAARDSVFTVSAPMPSVSEISRFVAPVVSRRRTSRSRGLSAPARGARLGWRGSKACSPDATRRSAPRSSPPSHA